MSNRRNMLKKPTDFEAQEDDNSPQTVAEEIYGKSDLAVLSGGIKAKPIPITTIHADVTQPRRLAPSNVRGDWDGTSDKVPTLLIAWIRHAKLKDNEVVEMLMGKRSIITDEQTPTQANLASVIQLAADIRANGLTNPVTISPRGAEYTIVAGERRWWAYQLLYLFIDEKEYFRLPSIISDKTAWELAATQASENNSRQDLNAIGKSRQLAKLLMIARERDTQYDSFSNMVVVGGCDRPYYAQVHNGNLHPIPYGMGTQFETALGISTGQMRQYRALLKLTDDNDVNNAIWTKADDNNWSEYALRNAIVAFNQSNLQLALLREIVLGGDSWTLKDIEALAQNAPRTVTTETHLPDESVTIDTHLPTPAATPSLSTGRVGVGSLSRFLPNNPQLEEETKPTPDLDHWLGFRVTTVSGHEGIVSGIVNGSLRVQMDGGYSIVTPPDALTKLSASQQTTIPKESTPSPSTGRVGVGSLSGGAVKPDTSHKPLSTNPPISAPPKLRWLTDILITIGTDQQTAGILDLYELKRLADRPYTVKDLEAFQTQLAKSSTAATAVLAQALTDFNLLLEQYIQSAESE